jgi:hypothetical protein
VPANYSGTIPPVLWSIPIPQSGNNPTGWQVNFGSSNGNTVYVICAQ